MAEITAALVKELRERSGVGMMDCKKALQENDGNIEAAIDWLRAKGLSKAAKKADRVAAEGLVAVASKEDGKGEVAAAIEFNAETDFVARNELFQNAAKDVAQVALDNEGVEAISAAKTSAGETVSDTITNLIATIGENQVLRRAKRVEVSNGAVIPYVHNAAAPGLGKIGVLVALESDAGVDVLEPLGKQIAMHIAAAFPLALDEAGLDADILERERQIATEKAAESGKPAEIIEKMVEGAVRKFAKENALLSQLFVMDNKTPVADVVAKAGKDAGTSIVLKDYVRFQLGEGIEKEESDFAAEVAATAGLTK